MSLITNWPLTSALPNYLKGIYIKSLWHIWFEKELHIILNFKEILIHWSEKLDLKVDTMSSSSNVAGPFWVATYLYFVYNAYIFRRYNL